MPLNLFNRLEAIDSGTTVNSVKGSNINVVGAIDFTQNGYFGKCASLLSGTAGGKHIEVSFAYRSAGCIEMWYIPNFSSSSTTTYYLFDMRNEGLQTAVNNSSTLGLIWYPPNSTNTALGPQLAYSYPSAYSAGDKIHIAFVWDSNGISGLGVNFAFYWNGSRATKTGGSGSESATVYAGPATITGATMMSDRTNATGCNCGIDNLKIWNYAKTDFSDRFTERYGCRDHVIQ